MNSYDDLKEYEIDIKDLENGNLYGYEIINDKESENQTYTMSEEETFKVIDSSSSETLNNLAQHTHQQKTSSIQRTRQEVGVLIYFLTYLEYLHSCFLYFIGISIKWCSKYNKLKIIFFPENLFVNFETIKTL